MSSAVRGVLRYPSLARMEARRCTIHGLVAADDGRCVICRRGDAAQDAGPQPMSATTMVIILGGCALGGIFAYWLNREPLKHAMLVDPPAKIVQPPPQPPPPLPPPRPQPQPVAPPTQPVSNGGVTENTGMAAPEDPKLTAAKQRVSIKMYSSDACVYCTVSKRWLALHQYRYSEYNIDQSDTDKVEMQSLNPAMTVPTFDVGGVPVIGFDPATLDSAITRVATSRMR